ncbi:MAG: hypothetical protein ABSF45_26025 [Terriglobia bacterium]
MEIYNLYFWEDPVDPFDVEDLQKVEEHVPELDTKNSRMPISSRPGPGVELNQKDGQLVFAGAAQAVSSMAQRRMVNCRAASHGARLARRSAVSRGAGMAPPISSGTRASRVDQG